MYAKVIARLISRQNLILTGKWHSTLYVGPGRSCRFFDVSSCHSCWENKNLMRIVLLTYRALIVMHWQWKSGLDKVLLEMFTPWITKLQEMLLKLINTNVVVSRHIKREEVLLPVAVRHWKTPELNLNFIRGNENVTHSAQGETAFFFLGGGGGRRSRRSEKVNVYFANYRFSFRKLQILISQTTDFHSANYRFSFRFVPFRFVPFRFANYSKPPTTRDHFRAMFVWYSYSEKTFPCAHVARLFNVWSTKSRSMTYIARSWKWNEDIFFRTILKWFRRKNDLSGLRTTQKRKQKQALKADN